MMRIVNSLRRNLVKLHIEGSINQEMEHRNILHLQQNVGYRTQAILVIINSFGGSIKSATNIANYLKHLVDQKQIPVYCFAEQYCLSSANLILSAGTKCYANKLSILGDIGYVFQGYHLCQESETKATESINHNNRTQQNKYFSIQQISNHQPKLVFAYQPTSIPFIQRFVQKEEHHLKTEIIRNRLPCLKARQIQINTFHQQILQKGLIQPALGLQWGFIDGEASFQSFIDENFHNISISTDGETRQYGVVQWLRRFIETSKDQ